MNWQTLRLQLSGWAVEARATVHSVFSLTPREREGVLLVCALFVFGLAVRWLRWLLG